jgi:DNA polymerase-3 subunit epsilon
MVFDTETTGLPKTSDKTDMCKWPHVVQLSYIIYDTDTNKIITAFDNIIKMGEGVSISKESTNIHHITDEMSQEQGVDINYAMGIMYNDILNIDCLIAHNIQFDLNMIIVECNRLIEMQPTVIPIMKFKRLLTHTTFIKKTHCTMKKNIAFCNIEVINKKTQKKYNKYPKLSELHMKIFNTEPKKLHNSFNDVLICLRCYCKINNKIDICNENSYINEQMQIIGIL